MVFSGPDAHILEWLHKPRRACAVPWPFTSPCLRFVDCVTTTCLQDLGLRFDKITYTSDYFPQLLDMGERLIKVGRGVLAVWRKCSQAFHVAEPWLFQQTQCTVLFCFVVVGK